MLNATEYRDTYLALHVCINARVPVILWGPPGQGKTSVIKALASHEERTLKVLLASIREPQDFAGLPSIQNGRVTLVAPDWAQDLAEDGNGILFMDEVNTAPPAVQAALLRVSLDKVAGDCELGERTSIVAAANPPEQAADGWDLAPPLANRFCHLDWELPSEIVRNGIAGNWPSYSIPSVDEAELAAALDSERAILGGFLMTRSDLTTVLPSSTSEQGRAFPTPRSWEIAGHLSAWITAAGMAESVRRLLIRGVVGSGAAAEYLTYRDNADLPQPEAVLENVAAFVLPKRADQVFVIGASVINAVRSNVTPDRWHAAGALLEAISAKNPDIAVSLAHDWLKIRPVSKDPKKPIMPDPKVLHSMLPLLVAAGMI